MVQNRFLNFFKGDVVEEIKKAAKDKKTVSIAYKDAKGDVTQRECEPYEIKDNGVYMYCHMRNEIRFFKLDNILNAKETNTPFTPRFPIEIE
jgi:predicted DNA-binding transcriptional regulator YafY